MTAPSGSREKERRVTDPVGGLVRRSIVLARRYRFLRRLFRRRRRPFRRRHRLIRRRRRLIRRRRRLIRRRRRPRRHSERKHNVWPPPPPPPIAAGRGAVRGVRPLHQDGRGRQRGRRGEGRGVVRGGGRRRRVRGRRRRRRPRHGRGRGKRQAAAPAPPPRGGPPHAAVGELHALRQVAEAAHERDAARGARGTRAPSCVCVCRVGRRPLGRPADRGSRVASASDQRHDASTDRTQWIVREESRTSRVEFTQRAPPAPAIARDVDVRAGARRLLVRHAARRGVGALLVRGRARGVEEATDGSAAAVDMGLLHRLQRVAAAEPERDRARRE